MKILCMVCEKTLRYAQMLNDETIHDMTDVKKKIFMK